jgi:SAM-dependent methyltransferase
MINAPYDQIAAEYYDPCHKTCRNFDHTTVVAFEALRSRSPVDGLVLDVGAGRGRCKEFLGIDPKRVIHLDNSSVMLALQPREESLLRILHEAETLPFCDFQFSCVMAFLCDAFLGLNFLAEVYRVLLPGGSFVATTPSYEWGIALRKELRISPSVTRFITKGGTQVVVPSVLIPGDKLLEMLKHVGFKQSKVQLRRHRLPLSASPISQDISMPAKSVGCDVHDLDILYSVVAEK